MNANDRIEYAYNTRQVAVRVVLFNHRGEILLQGVNVPGKPPFYITPGGRLEKQDMSLIEAARREILQETGFEDIEFTTTDPIFSGNHVLQRSNGPVAMTEHFFVARLLSSDDAIDHESLRLTEEEQQVFTDQKWLALAALSERKVLVVPVNLYDFAKACLEGRTPPPVDFSDPPEFRV